VNEPPGSPAHGSPSKPDIAANAFYPILARASLFEVYANLLDLLWTRIAASGGPRNIVVVGPGAEALPFSEHREAVTTLVNGGNLILLDYNRDICDALPGFLERTGFGRPFRIERCRADTMIDVTRLHNTILIMEWNIRHGFPLPEASVDVMDMTVALHHVTQYVADVDTLFGHARRVLKDGGILHIGEGNVDMKYSERKLRRLAQDVYACGVRGVVVSDERCADVAPRQWHVGESVGEATIRIAPSGMLGIHHPDGARLATCLRNAGYKQMYVTNTLVVLPLIDHAMEEDFQGMIAPVRAFYRVLFELTLRRLDPAHHDEFFTVAHKEQSDAERGIVEYYSLPSVLCDALVTNGFTLDEMRFTKQSPFVNILAIKRTAAGSSPSLPQPHPQDS